MLFKSTEMNVQFMQMLKECTERSTCGHLCESIHILREALATIAELAVRTRDIGVGVVDVTRKEHAGVNLAPIATHLLAVLAASVEVGYLVCTKHIVHILSEFGLQRSHNCKLLTNENLR